MLCSFIVRNITTPFIDDFQPAANGRGIMDFTVTAATKPTATTAGRSLREDAALSLIRPVVLRMAAVIGRDPDIAELVASYLDLVSLLVVGVISEDY